MNKKVIEIDINEKDLLEKLSELEHQQWSSYSKSVLKIVQNATSLEELENELTNKWHKNWIMYKELPEIEKDKDRIWASKIIKILLDKQIAR